MKRKPARGEMAPSMMMPAKAQPMPTAPVKAQVAPTTPMMAPMMEPGPYPVGPAAVAPVRRVVHPTRVQERHMVMRYPIENIYPTHTRNIRHHVCEYYCEYPHSESVQDCYHMVDHCCPPPFFRGPF